MEWSDWSMALRTSRNTQRRVTLRVFLRLVRHRTGPARRRRTAEDGAGGLEMEDFGRGESNDCGRRVDGRCSCCRGRDRLSSRLGRHRCRRVNVPSRPREFHPHRSGLDTLASSGPDRPRRALRSLALRRCACISCGPGMQLNGKVVIRSLCVLPTGLRHLSRSYDPCHEFVRRF